MSPSAIDPTLHSPRILCLHGGGTNAPIFQAQCRTLIRRLSPSFRLVFADGPFFCAPHHAILPVYEGMGPYRRWMRWLPEHAEVDDEAVVQEMEFNMREAMLADDGQGATGEWIGLLGFSQGSKVLASILFDRQVRIDERKREKESGGGQAIQGRKASMGMYGGFDDDEEDDKQAGDQDQVEGLAGGTWRFGVLMAGSAPLVDLRTRKEDTVGRETLAMPGDMSRFDIAENLTETKNRVRFPTVHVHGLNDPGLPLHRKLMDPYCETGTTQLIEWGGDHRVPFKTGDVEPIVEAIFKAAKIRQLV